MDSRATPCHDPALLPFLRTSDLAEAERLLADLLCHRERGTDGARWLTMRFDF